MQGTQGRAAGRRGEDGGETRRRILAVAAELFATKGYAGTSIADIAARMEMSKAALYYHFTSKEQILDELLAAPLAAFARLAERAETGAHTPAELLAAVIDTTVEARALSGLIGGDPSAQAVVNRSRHGDARRINDALAAALARGAPGEGAAVRAQAALTVAKQVTLTVLGDGGPMSAGTRAEILAAALRALGAT
ncbi:helix-turn-helix domain-containing protein [Microbispora hainanensis]|uniref:Helix-turn-helix transcriptional regulator n=1 Tax=Microbispora hainanensis TaxID=568844 RepID=A0A544YKV2_9ACTN|nr:helix-turn-helix domain-containing protein [Microbispora hainanensis]TQS17403.1 helix-turn-helix transcriptional regulator [Microbispora hainanensis]